MEGANKVPDPPLVGAHHLCLMNHEVPRNLQFAMQDVELEIIGKLNLDFEERGSGLESHKKNENCK